MSGELAMFAVVVGVAYMLVCLVDPWVDCGWCKGAPKRRSSGVGLTLALGVGVALLGGWLGIPVGPVLFALAVFWVAITAFGGSRSYHFCSVPMLLGGCGGSGRRRRLGSLVMGRGLGKLD